MVAEKGHPPAPPAKGGRQGRKGQKQAAAINFKAAA